MTSRTAEERDAELEQAERASDAELDALRVENARLTEELARLRAVEEASERAVAVIDTAGIIQFVRQTGEAFLEDCRARINAGAAPGYRIVPLFQALADHDHAMRTRTATGHTVWDARLATGLCLFVIDIGERCWLAHGHGGDHCAACSGSACFQTGLSIDERKPMILISIVHTRKGGRAMSLWAPGNSGYVGYLCHAGRYAVDDAARTCLETHGDNLAVPEAEVRKHLQHGRVPNTPEVMRALKRSARTIGARPEPRRPRGDAMGGGAAVATRGRRGRS